MATYNVEIMATGNFSRVVPVEAGSLVEALEKGMKSAKEDEIAWTMDDLITEMEVKAVLEY